jgi:hypothetical protein
MTNEQQLAPPRGLLFRALDVLFVAVCLGVLAIPALNMVTPLFVQRPLAGVVAPLAMPKPSLGSFFSEKLQAGFTKYFEQNYGARPLATRIDNSLAYWVFGELPPDKAVRVGTSDVLYIDDQVSFYNRRDQPDAPAMAAKVKRAQDLLLARGKVFVVMLVPTKATIWPDDVPVGWRREGASVDNVRARISDPFIDALRRAGALFVDGRRSVAQLPREAIYTKVGRHLAAPASCLVFSEALDIVRPRMVGAEVPPISCSYRMAHGLSLDREDYDLFKLLNIWTPPPAMAVPLMDPGPEAVAHGRRAKAMVIGSSFGWGVVNEAERTHAFAHLYYHYYTSTLVDRDGLPDRTVKCPSKEWLDVVDATDVFFYSIPEEYLIGDGEVFVDGIIASFGEPSSSPPRVQK